MEMDPLKVPAFLRKKTSSKRKKSAGTSTSYKPSKTTKPKPIKIKVPKRLGNSIAPSIPPSMYADPMPIRSAYGTGDLKLVGVVTDYLDKIKVAIIKLGMDIEVGEKMQLPGENGPYKQIIKSMQINRENVEIASRNDEIGMKVNKKVKVGEFVYVIG
jgi:hypothetical protein